jgi:hypothetical protein
MKHLVTLTIALLLTGAAQAATIDLSATTAQLTTSDPVPSAPTSVDPAAAAQSDLNVIGADSAAFGFLQESRQIECSTYGLQPACDEMKEQPSVQRSEDSEHAIDIYCTEGSKNPDATSKLACDERDELRATLEKNGYYRHSEEASTVVAQQPSTLSTVATPEDSSAAGGLILAFFAFIPLVILFKLLRRIVR